MLPVLYQSFARSYQAILISRYRKNGSPQIRPEGEFFRPFRIICKNYPGAFVLQVSTGKSIKGNFIRYFSEGLASIKVEILKSFSIYSFRGLQKWTLS